VRDLWAVLEELVEDPEPSEKFEAEYLARDTDAIELSLNTERPKAMQAVLAYAFWVRKHLLSRSKGRQTRSGMVREDAGIPGSA